MISIGKNLGSKDSEKNGFAETKNERAVSRQELSGLTSRFALGD